MKETTSYFRKNLFKNFGWLFLTIHFSRDITNLIWNDHPVYKPWIAYAVSFVVAILYTFIMSKNAKPKLEVGVNV